MAIREAYEQYFSTRLYDRRYPRPNRRTLAILSRSLPAGSTVIDIGAGNGRYALPLARMGCDVVAVEPSEAGRARIAERVADERAENRVAILGDVAEVEPDVLAGASAAMLLFGVLGHLTYAERSGLLATLSRSMKPGARLLGSVPNRSRRFRREQRESTVDDGGRPPRVSYARGSGADALVLELTLFSPADVRAELTSAGWRCESLTAESLMPEAVVTSRPWAGYVDALVSAAAPAGLGYCIFFVATNSPTLGGPASPLAPA